MELRSEPLLLNGLTALRQMADAGPYHSMALAVVSLLAFACAALLAARDAACQHREDKRGLSIAMWRAPSVLPSCLAASFAVRCLWIVLRGLVDPRKVHAVAEQLVNRTALLFYFTGYAFVVALVADRVRVQDKGFLSTTGTSRTWRNLWRGVAAVWVISFATSAWWALERSNHVTRYFLPALFFLLSLLFLRYGLRLHALALRHRGGSVGGGGGDGGGGGGGGGGLVAPTYWLAVAACVSAVLFFVRFALYLYEAASNKYIQGSGVLYPYFFYEVPELVPGALILLAMRHLRTLRGAEMGVGVDVAPTRDAQQSLITSSSQRYMDPR